MTAKILMFPASRIAEASAEIFAKRTEEWKTEETADEILRSMAGMPIPKLTNLKIIDCQQESLMDLLEDFSGFLARLVDYAERNGK